MRLLLHAYPRRWRERYGEELLALLEDGQLTPRIRADVALAGLRERLRGAGPPQLRVLWAWSLFVVGGIAFQKTSEHWQLVVPGADHPIPMAAFDSVQVAAAIGSIAVLAGVAVGLPGFLRDLRSGGWTVLRRPILAAAAGSLIAVVSLAALATDHGLVPASLFIASALFSLFAWTHAAVAAALRLPPQRVQTRLSLVVTTTMAVMTLAATAWFGSVTAHAPSFVGAAQLAVVATFMLVPTALAAASSLSSLRG